MMRSEKWQQFKAFVKDLIAQYIDDNVPVAGAAIAFYLLLSLVPLLLLLLTVATFFVRLDRIESIIDNLLLSLGPGVGGAIRDQLLFIATSIIVNRGLLTGISLMLSLWIGSQVFATIEAVMNQVWGTEERRPFWKRRGLAILMVFVAGILVLLAIGMNYFVRVIGSITFPYFGQLEKVPWIITILLGYVLPAILSWLVFVILYHVMPAQQVGFYSVFIGAAAAAVVWTLVLQTFSWYTAHIANYSLLYGTLGGLVLLMLWFNYSSQIMIMGAEIAALLHQQGKQTR